MTLQEISRDIVPIASLAIAFFGLLFIWIELKSATKTMEQTSNWNRINSTYTFFNLESNTRIERELYREGTRLGIKFMAELSGDELEKLWNDNDCFVLAKEFLNDFESLCAAYQVGALDKNLAFHMYGTRVVKEYSVFKPLIHRLRNRFKDQGILIEIERTANEWSERLEKENAEIEAARANVGAVNNENL